MTKSAQQKMKKAKPKPVDQSKLELDPDAWPKFEKLVKNAAKIGHKPHAKP